MQQNMRVTHSECPARRVPAGDLVIIPKGQFVTINQTLGGNYTVTWQGNMLRIDGVDAAAIGYEPEALHFDDDGSGMVKEDHIWQALDSIFDPEIPVSLVSLGLIYAVSIDQNTGMVAVSMTLTAPGCGMGPVLVGDVEYRVAIVPNVKAVKVDLIFDPPWSKEMMSEEAQLETGLFF